MAWQIDNELGHEGSDLCWCPQCHKAFQEFLREKFRGDIGLLNETYGTAFWSQEYNDFDEIPMPRETITTHNPSLRLDWERFRSETIVKFARFQAELLHEIIPGAVVLHDFRAEGLGSMWIIPGWQRNWTGRLIIIIRYGEARGNHCHPMRSPLGWTISGA